MKVFMISVNVVVSERVVNETCMSVIVFAFDCRYICENQKLIVGTLAAHNNKTLSMERRVTLAIFKSISFAVSITVIIYAVYLKFNASCLLGT